MELRGGVLEVEEVREEVREGRGDEGKKKRKKCRSHLRVEVHWSALQPDPLGLDLVGAQREVPCVLFSEEIVIKGEREREKKEKGK